MTTSVWVFACKCCFSWSWLENLLGAALGESKSSSDKAVSNAGMTKSSSNSFLSLSPLPSNADGKREVWAREILEGSKIPSDFCSGRICQSWPEVPFVSPKREQYQTLTTKSLALEFSCGLSWKHQTWLERNISSHTFSCSQTLWMKTISPCVTDDYLRMF
jgi:hypothetical protein